MINHYINAQKIADSKSPSSSIFTTLVVILMFGSVYTVPCIPCITWGEILILCFCPYFMVKLNNFKMNHSDISMLWFCVYSCFLTVGMTLIFKGNFVEPVGRMFRDLFYIVLVFVFGKKFLDIDLFKKQIIYFCMILSAFVVVQTIVWYLAGYLIPGLILHLQISDGHVLGRVMHSNLIDYARIAGYIKPNGFLCEPSHCGYCLIIGVIICLFDDTCVMSRKKFRDGIIMTLALICTMSTTAMVGIVFVWSMWFMAVRQKTIKESAIIWFAILSMLITFCVNNNAYNHFKHAIVRFTDLFANNPSVISNSVFLRVAKGWQVFYYLPLQYKIIGIGFGNYMNALSANIIPTAYIYEPEIEFMSSFTYILLSSGIIGMCLFITYFIIAYRQKNASLLIKVAILCYFLLAMGTTIYSSEFGVWLLLIINSCMRCDKRAV